MIFLLKVYFFFFSLFFDYTVEYYDGGYYTADGLNSFDAPVTFPCPRNCGRRYKHKNYINFHLKYECGVPKKFKCDICGKAFARNDTCKTHKILKHKIV